MKISSSGNFLALGTFLGKAVVIDLIKAQVNFILYESKLQYI